MTEAANPVERSRLDIWMQAVRSFSFPASLVPVFVGAALVFSFEGAVLWWLFPVVIVCSVLFHAATNLHSDYFDHKKQVDKGYTYGGSGVLVGNLLTARSAYIGGWVLYAVAAALGLLLVYFRGMPMLALGVVGIIGGYFYCATPVGYKYVGLGDLLVFILMGPLMVIGSYLALTGAFEWRVLIVSIPVGCLVAAILSANNTRDIKHDSEAGVKTLESILGQGGAKATYYVLVLGAYLSVALMAAFGVVSPWALIVFISLPIALGNIKAMKGSDVDEPEKIAALDVMSAKLHAAFGLLFTVSLTLGALL